MQTNRLCILLLLLVAGFGRHAQGQDQDEWYRHLSQLRMSGPVPFYQNAVIVQVEETRALNYILGQVRLLGKDTIRAPLWENWVDTLPNIRPLFRFNSMVYEDTLKTESAEVQLDDTLVFLVRHELILPGTEEDPDTNTIAYGIIFEDSIRFLVDLVDAVTNELLLELDTLTFIKADSLVEWMQNLTEQAMMQGKNSFHKRYVLPHELEGRQVSVRVLVDYRGPFSRRWIDRQFRWMEYLNMETDRDFRAVCDSILLWTCIAFDLDCSSLGIEPESISKMMYSREADFDVHIHPNPGNGIVSIAADLKVPGDLAVSVISGDGRTLRYRTFEDMYRGRNVFQLNLSDLPQGVYFIVSILNDDMVTVTIFNKF